MRRAILKSVGAGGVLAVMAASVALAQPAGLTGVDVGTPTLPGSTTIAAGKVTVIGSGDDIWNSNDSFHYAYFSVTGDFDYVVRLESLSRSEDAAMLGSSWAKAELMARLPAVGTDVPAGDDPHISNMANVPGPAATGGENHRGPQWRSHRTGDMPTDPTVVDPYTGVSTWTTPNPEYPPNPPNQWLRLERVGSIFWMYTSNDRTNWNGYTPYAVQGWDTAGSFPPGTDNPAQAFFDSAWPAKINLGLAVTSHDNSTTSKAVFSDFVPYTPIAIAITTQPPATKDIVASMPLVLTVAATGDPVHFQWRKNGNPVPQAAYPTLNIPISTLGDAGTYTCRVYGGGREIISSPTVVTVTADTTAPTIVGARADGSFTAVSVTFDGPLGASGTNMANYSISPSLAITAADPIPIVGNTAFFSGVKLTTARQALATTYTVTVNNVKDYSGNTIAANSTTTFKSAEELKGFAFWERWDDANGDLGDLNAFGLALDDTVTPVRAPDVTRTVTTFDGPWGTADNYNSRLRTYFTPATSGTYVFYVSADDGAYLYLSTDENPANKKIIAQESGWSNDLQWTNPGSPVLAADGTGTDGGLWKCSTTFPDVYSGSEAMWGGPITLVAGKKYYMEARENEGGGGDGVGATFVMQGAAGPANGAGSALTGNLISWFESIDNLSPSILTAPVSTVVLAPGATTNLWINAFGSKLTYQWMLNGKDIAGATATNYTIANASLASIGQYSVKVTNPNGTATSSLSKVMVTATGVFTIEAEDFDYNRGQSLPVASVMPYVGAAYTNLGAVFDVDYHNTDALDSTQARPGLPAGQNANTEANMGGVWGSTRFGEWTMTNNYKIGWVGGGDWGNYTRTFPTPAKSYYVFAAQSYDGLAASQLSSTLGIVSAGVGTTNQTVDLVGTFDCVGSGGWSQNNLVAMTDVVGGTMKAIELGGTKTIRWNYSSGDADYLVFIPSGAPAGPKIDGITIVTGGKIKITWTGAATLQSSPTLPATSWTDLTGAVSGGELTPPASGGIYYRLKQ